MRLVDLTHTFGNDMPVYPGDPAAVLVQVASVEKDGFADHHLTTGMHVGTHIDAPLHFVEGGKYLDEVDPERFFGRGKLLDARGRSKIDVDLLEGAEVNAGDILLVRTDRDKEFYESDYYTSYPPVTEAFARRCVEIEVKILCLDTPSPDYQPFAVHKVLLGAGILIAESLTGLGRLSAEPFDVIALPAKLHAAGGPVRVVAVYASPL